MLRVSRFEIFDGIVSWVLGIVLVISAIPHLGNPYFFLGSVYAYQMVSPNMGQFTVMILPVLQLFLAVCDWSFFHRCRSFSHVGMFCYFRNGANVSIGSWSRHFLRLFWTGT